MRLIRSELMKLRTTNVWWLFGIGVLLFTALALLTGIGFGGILIDNAVANSNEVFLPPPAESGISKAEVEQARQQWEIEHDLQRTLNSVTANIYTAGQFFGLMFVMLLGAILVTNEFYHQTATATFLTTPQRTKVIVGKLGTAVLAAGFFWVLTTAISLAAGGMFLTIKGYGLQLDQWPVLRAILMNGFAYGLWGILGVGLGVLIRNQIGAVITGVVGYLLGYLVIQIVVGVVYAWLEKDWILKAIVAWPGVASQIMISPETFYAGSPKWWVGAIVLIGYGVVFSVIGTLIARKRDIS